MQAERGERYGGVPPYGYMKDPADSKRLIPDEETVPIVRHIFELCASGKGPSQIARQLKEERILTPSGHYYQQTGKSLCRVNPSHPYDWAKHTISDMLINPVYLGHTLGLQTTFISYKNKTKIQRPKGEQILVENTHEPIISKELWDIVQDVRAHKRRPAKQMDEPNLFSGLVYCADCGKLMTLSRSRKMREEQSALLMEGGARNTALRIRFESLSWSKSS